MIHEKYPYNLCPVCGYDCKVSSNYKHWGWPDTTIFDGLLIITCDDCGFSFLENEIPCSQLSEFYEREYRKVSSPFYWDYGSTFEIPRSLPTRSTAQIYLATIFTEFLPGNIFLDIGPGPGDSLFSAGHILNKPKLIAIEPNQDSASYYDRNFGAKSIASLSDMSASGLKAKIILLSHSLEHFRHSDLPILFKAINEVLDVGGVIIIEVPNVDFRVHRHLRFPDTPHTVFFSKDSLCRLLIKSGYEIKHIQVLGNSYPYSHLPSILDCPRVKNKNKITYRHALKKLFTKLHMLDYFLALRKVLKRMKYIRQDEIKMNLASFNDFINDSNFDTIRVAVTLRSDRVI